MITKNCWESLTIIHEWLRITRNQQKSLKNCSSINENYWELFDNYWESLRITQNCSESWEPPNKNQGELFENYWESPRIILESLRNSVNHWELWESLRIRIMRITANHIAQESARIIRNIKNDLRITYNHLRITENHLRNNWKWLRITKESPIITMNQWKLLNNQLEPFKNHENCLELARIIQENHLRIRIIDDHHELLRITEFMKGWESLRITKNQWETLKIFQELMRITENYLTIAENQWESLMMNQNFSRIMKITENCLRLRMIKHFWESLRTIRIVSESYFLCTQDNLFGAILWYNRLNTSY